MVSNISCLRVFAVCFGLLAVFRELFFSLSPFLRLVSSVQAIMASSAGYIIACSCEDIIEDQWVSAEDMWQDITENILVWVYMQGSVFYYIQHCFTWCFLFSHVHGSLSPLFTCVAFAYTAENSHFLWSCSQMCRSVKVFPSLLSVSKNVLFLQCAPYVSVI